MAFELGLQIGKYELGKKLGQGGFGAVYVARDTGLDRDVALKFLHPEHTANPQILQRFMQEARSAAKIVHPGIVTIYECGLVSGTGTIDGTAFIAMELLNGESLTDRLTRSGRLGAPAAMEVCRQLASALEAAHRAGIVHRDLKPDNVFLVADPAVPSGERVKILDFGIAKLAQSASISNVHTASMMVFGTPRYMSPEQCKSATNIDHRSDIYTLGCILFELVCGRLPFNGGAGELIAMHQLVEPPKASSFVEIPVKLDDLITEMLAKEPIDRPQTMTLVQRTLEAGGALAAGSETTLPPGAFEGSMPRFTPAVAFGVPPPPLVARTASTVKSSPPGANPTTLSAATGASLVERRRSRRPYIVFGFLGAGAVAGGVVLATRKPDKAPVQVAQLPADAGITVVPIVTPPDAPAVVAVIVDAADVPVAAPTTTPPTPTPPKPKGPVTTPAPFSEASISINDVATNLAHVCFDKFAKSHAPITGRLDLKLKVDVFGRGTAIATGLPAEIASCVSRKFEAWKFPRTRSPITLAAAVPYESTKVPDTKVPDTKVPDTKVPDTKPPDTKVPDTKPPDTKVPDTKPPDTKVPKPCDQIKDGVVDPFNKTPCR